MLLDVQSLLRACRIVVTSRINPYRRGDYQLSGLPVYVLAPLDSEQVARSIHRWYDELNRIGHVADVDLVGVRSRLLLAIEQRPKLRGQYPNLTQWQQSVQGLLSSEY